MSKYRVRTTIGSTWSQKRWIELLLTVEQTESGRWLGRASDVGRSVPGYDHHVTGASKDRAVVESNLRAWAKENGCTEDQANRLRKAHNDESERQNRIELDAQVAAGTMRLLERDDQPARHSWDYGQVFFRNGKIDLTNYHTGRWSPQEALRLSVALREVADNAIKSGTK